MSRMPRWGLVTALASPILLVGGWTVAARMQPGSFDSSTQTISALAGADASDRWVMTMALLGVGATQIATAAALRPAARAGRALFAAGGVFTLLVAANPLPAAGQQAPVHAAVAAGSFAALAIWPLVSWKRGPDIAWGLRPAVALTAGGALMVVTGCFFVAVLSDAGKVGLAERGAALALNLWPVAVAGSVWRSQRQP